MIHMGPSPLAFQFRREWILASCPEDITPPVFWGLYNALKFEYESIEAVDRFLYPHMYGPPSHHVNCRCVVELEDHSNHYFDVKTGQWIPRDES